MAIDTPKGEVRWFDDFVGSTLNTGEWVATVTSTGTVAITDVEIDGTVQLDTGATDERAAQLAGNLNWRPQDGSLRLEARVKSSVVTTLRQFIGFTYATSETEDIPIARSTTVWSAAATTAIGFSFDVDATNDYSTCSWVDDSAATTESISDLEFSGLAPVADKYYTYILELQDQGSGKQVRADFTVIDNNGRMYTKTFASTIDRDIVLCPYIGHQNSTATAHETTVDYVEVTKSRAADID